VTADEAAGEAQCRGSSRPRDRYSWQETGERLHAFTAQHPETRAAKDGRSFTRDVGPDEVARFALPFLLPATLPGETPAAYLARLPDRLGRQCILLLQAGAVAMGFWDEDELLRHKAFKRYVVRGSGKAQPTHLKTKGRSRYGSRLRLQMWKRLLEETNERLGAWWQELGAADQVCIAVNVRHVAAMFGTSPPPPFARDDPRLRRIPLHVHVPDFEELLRVRRHLAHGTVAIVAREG
jgi:Bacteroidetes VLRF1 release factor